MPAPASPRISIVTPCLNRVEFIAEAVESVLAQGYPDVEHIVMDGGSTDGTLDVLGKYPHLRVVSEPDSGLYDAINKGVRRAGGDVVGLLNTDDVFPPGTLARVGEVFRRRPEADLVSGGAEVFERDPAGVERVRATYAGPDAVPLAWNTLLYGVPIINARFFRRELLERVGLFDTGYGIAADREFLFRVLLAGPREERVEGVLYRYRHHSGSLTFTRLSAPMLRKLWEHLTLAARYAANGSLPADLRGRFRRWHGCEAAQGVVEAALAGDPAQALRFAGRGWRYSGTWPARLVEVLWRRAARVARRRGERG